MRKLIIDTDTGTDDAVALLLALLNPDVEVLCITTVAGNIPLAQATSNALTVIDQTSVHPPVYCGACGPLFRPLVTADSVHGKDGLGDRDLSHPKSSPQAGFACDRILELVNAYPGEIEIVALGPAINLALAILKDRATMQKVKRIYSMGTAGFGSGNCSPVAEFNVYVDAESYSILLQSGIPLTIIGFDQCLGPAALDENELQRLRSGGPLAHFVGECTSALTAFNHRRTGRIFADLPDAVAMAAALWDDFVLETVPAYCYCCTKEAPAYGQVIIYDQRQSYSVAQQIPPQNADVVKRVDASLFRKRLMEILLSAR